MPAVHVWELKACTFACLICQVWTNVDKICYCAIYSGSSCWTHVNTGEFYQRDCVTQLDTHLVTIYFLHRSRDAQISGDLVSVRCGQVFSVKLFLIFLLACKNVYQFTCTGQKAPDNRVHRQYHNFGPSVCNCLVSLFWRLEFSGGFRSFGKFVGLWHRVGYLKRWNLLHIF